MPFDHSTQNAWEQFEELSRRAPQGRTIAHRVLVGENIPLPEPYVEPLGPWITGAVWGGLLLGSVGFYYGAWVVAKVIVAGAGF